jgi:hypothetical protein
MQQPDKTFFSSQLGLAHSVSCPLIMHHPKDGGRDTDVGHANSMTKQIKAKGCKK